MADEKPKNRLEKIGSLWGHTDTNGDKFYAGEFTVALPSIIQPGMNVMVFTVKPENKVENGPVAEIFIPIPPKRAQPTAAKPTEEKEDLPF